MATNFQERTLLSSLSMNIRDMVVKTSGKIGAYCFGGLNISIYPNRAIDSVNSQKPQSSNRQCESEATRRIEPKRVSKSKVEALKDIPGQTCSMLVDEIGG